jgi:predicted O-methyltransferase YrrM
MLDDLEFTNNWFGHNAEKIWNQLLPQIKPTKILEIGSYEGRSTCYLIEKNNWAEECEIHCIDNWEGGFEEKKINDLQDKLIEERFDYNTKLLIDKVSSTINLVKHKGFSDHKLSWLLSNGYANYFDFVYIDGSHMASDVLLDAVLSFRLLKIGGYMGFDDYLWTNKNHEFRNPNLLPKIAIDAFTNIYCTKLNFCSSPNAQVYLQKVSD